MAKQKTPARKRRKRKLIVFIIELIILVLVIGVLYFYLKLDNIDVRQLDQSKIEVNEVTEEAAREFEGNTTVAIFGLDNRDLGVYESGNSDVIIVVNINNDTKEVSMASVYRDTYLNVAGAGQERKFRKCNSAYAGGGPERAITMLNRNLDLDIDYYVSVDFQAVANAIDILGGVDIEIESEKELKELGDYIWATNQILGTHDDGIATTGMHTLNGVQAVAYSRIRYTAGGDFKRAERQRRVLNEMMKKAKKANLSQLNKMFDEVFPLIQTDLSKKDMLALASAVLGYDMANSGGFPYDRTTDTPSKSIGSIVIPCNLESNVTELHRQLFGSDAYTPSETVKEYSQYIIDVTGKDVDDADKDQFSDGDDFDGTAEPEAEDTEE